MNNFFKGNEARWDRIVRIVLGIVLMALGFSHVIAGTAGTVVGMIGLIPLLTGLIGWCPAYAVLHFGTKAS